MRKIVLALAAVAAVGLAIPTFTSPAEARSGHVVVIKKKHHSHGRHVGWSKRAKHHAYGHRHRHGARVIVR